MQERRWPYARVRISSYTTTTTTTRVYANVCVCACMRRHVWLKNSSHGLRKRLNLISLINIVYVRKKRKLTDTFETLYFRLVRSDFKSWKNTIYTAGSTPLPPPPLSLASNLVDGSDKQLYYRREPTKKNLAASSFFCIKSIAAEMIVVVVVHVCPMKLLGTTQSIQRYCIDSHPETIEELGDPDSSMSIVQSLEGSE